MITLDQAGRDFGRAVVVPPPTDLVGVVEYYWYEPAPAVAGAACRIVPDPSCHLIFKTDPGPAGGSLRLVGPRSTFVDIDKTGRRMTVGARFRPGIVGGLFGCSPADLLDRSVAFPDVVGWPGAELIGRILTAGDVFAIVALISDSLRRCLAAGRPRDWRVDAAHHLLLSCAGETPGVADLAAATGNAERTLRDVLRSEVGFGFKRWAKIHRLSSLLHRALEVAEPHWATLAVAGGYYDQPHLIREHRQLLGETPAQFLLRGQRTSSGAAESSNPSSGREY